MKRVSHASTSTGTKMEFAVFLPPGAPAAEIPCLWWLSGLTCTDKNFAEKAGAFKAAAAAGLAIVLPDTSPRGAGVAGEDEAYDFGSGAGFYVDATAKPWAAHYQMETYVTKELPALCAAEFGLSRRLVSVCGHSMGGHGALTLAFKVGGGRREDGGERDPSEIRAVVVVARRVESSRGVESNRVDSSRVESSRVESIIRRCDIDTSP